MTTTPLTGGGIDRIDKLARERQMLDDMLQHGMRMEAILENLFAVVILDENTERARILFYSGYLSDYPEWRKLTLAILELVDASRDNSKANGES